MQEGGGVIAKGTARAGQEKKALFMSIKRLAKFMFGVQSDAGWFLLSNFKSQVVCCAVATLKSVFAVQSQVVCFFCA